MTKTTRQTIFYSIIFTILVSIFLAPGGIAAQASFPLAPLAPGHNIYFQAVGLPDGVLITLSGTRVNNGSHPATYTTSFTTPDLSPSINADPGSIFTFTGFPESITVNNQYFDLISIFPTSPITVGVSGGFTTVVASYEAACLPVNILVEPVSQTVQYGDPITFTLTATGSAPISFEWYKDNGLITGADQDVYSIQSASMSDAGMYHSVVSNACGTDTSAQAGLTVNKLNQTIIFEPPPTSAVYGSTFWVTPTASSGLEVSLAVEGSCTNSGFQVSMISGTGQCFLTASQAGNDIYNPATEVENTVDALKAGQSIDFAAPPSPAVYGTSFTLEATASSGLGVAFDVDGVCELSGNTVTMTSGMGSCTVAASQAGDDNYNPATGVEHTVAAAKANQSIDFAAPVSPVVFGTSFDLEATASSGLGVAFGVDGGCELSGNTVTMTSGTDSCTITANQPGDDNYNPATGVEHTVAAAKANQSIDFTTPASPAVYATSFVLQATASSGLAVAFEVEGECELSGNSVTMTGGTGSCTITASQAGDDNYYPAAGVEHTVAAAKANQSIEFTTPASPVVYATSFDLQANASSGLAVAFELEGECELSGNSVSMTSGSGSCTITASQLGDDNFTPAITVTHTVQAARAAQSISFPQPASPVKYQTSFSVSLSSSAGLLVGLSSSGSCTHEGYTVTITKTSGTCFLTAFQVGDENYLPAESVQHSVEPAPNGNMIYIPLLFGS